MPKLSVIVPVYNVEAFLPTSIESILNQSLIDLELILIDDGSPDNCGTICDQYALKDERVKVIHQSNRGVSHARNEGMKIAAGDYIGFVDPDDYVASDMYRSMIATAENSDCNISICGFAYCTESGEFIREDRVPSGIHLQRELILSIYGMPNQFHGSMCNKIFSRTLLSDLFFDETVAIGEDWLLLYECYMRAEKAVAVDQCYYTIRIRSNSATRKNDSHLYLRKLETYDKLFSYSLNKDKEIQRKAVDKILDTYLNNKNAIIQNDYDKKSLTVINRHMIKTAVLSFIRGNLSIKRAIYHVIKGFQY